MTNRVLALVPTSENDVLYGGTLGWQHLLRTKGYETDIVRLAEPKASQALERDLRAGVYRFAFAIQGIGSGLRDEAGQILWSSVETPFVALHFDHPSHNPINHFNESPYVGYLYPFLSFLETKKQYLSPVPQLARQATHAFTSLRSDPLMPLETRPIRLLYMKTGNNLSESNAFFDMLPVKMREAVFNQLECMRQNPNLLVADLVNEVFNALRIDRRQYEGPFWNIIDMMDFRIRYERAITFIEWLKTQEGAVIVGRGWDFIDKKHARATFRDAIPISQCYDMYKATQFLCNTSPYGPDIVHERVMNGLEAQCCVITDTNAWWDEHASDIPSLLRFSWNKPLDEQIPTMMNDPARRQAASLGRAHVARLFNPTSNPDLAAFAEDVRRFAENR